MENITLKNFINEKHIGAFLITDEFASLRNSCAQRHPMMLGYFETAPAFRTDDPHYLLERPTEISGGDYNAIKNILGVQCKYLNVEQLLDDYPDIVKFAGEYDIHWEEEEAVNKAPITGFFS